MEMYRSALRAIAADEYGYVVFCDAARPDRVVQVATSSPSGGAVIEATDRYDEAACGLDGPALARLATLGFDVTMEPFPQAPTTLDTVDTVDTAAATMDAAFLAMGAAPHFQSVLVASSVDDGGFADVHRS